MTTETTPAGEDIYAFQRRLARQQNRADAEAVEARGVVLMKSALRMGGVLGGLAAALDIAHETADELVTLDRRHTAYADPIEPTADDIAELVDIVAGGWVPAVPIGVAL